MKPGKLYIVKRPTQQTCIFKTTLTSFFSDANYTTRPTVESLIVDKISCGDCFIYLDTAKTFHKILYKNIIGYITENIFCEEVEVES